MQGLQLPPFRMIHAAYVTADLEAAIPDADVIFVSVNTPTKMFGRGAGKAADLQYWEKTARTIRMFDGRRVN